MCPFLVSADRHGPGVGSSVAGCVLSVREVLVQLWVQTTVPPLKEEKELARSPRAEFSRCRDSAPGGWCRPGVVPDPLCGDTIWTRPVPGF